MIETGKVKLAEDFMNEILKRKKMMKERISN